ncbi:TPA: hypothetical protein JLU04_004533 [Escherichia coli]|nr:hypothetical protein [Escherichia coli]
MQGGGGAPEGWDLIIVALSVGPVAGWGHLPSIRELGVEMSGDMLVLVLQARFVKAFVMGNKNDVMDGRP